MSLGQEIVGGVGVVAVFGLVVIWRLLRKEKQPTWRRLRVGVFVEREEIDDSQGHE